MTQNELYTGQGQAAWERVSSGWAKMKAAFLLELQIVRIEMHFLRARAALCAGGAHRSTNLLQSALADAASIEREKTPWGNALAQLVRALVASARAQPDAAAQLDQAARKLAACDMNLHAAIAQLRRGELIGGADGAASVSGSVATLQSEGIRNPLRFAALIAPICRS